MPITPSPLRYPGGKTKLYEYVRTILIANDIHGTYIEPFAGGAGLALKLLLNDDVERIVINDSDTSIYSFWDCVLNHSDELCNFIQNVPLSTEQWKLEHQIYQNQAEYNRFQIGAATLYLNRTNVSGVIKGGVIGGNDQNGPYKMDARFNRNSLCNKIITIANNKDRIDLYHYDIFDFLCSREYKHYYKAFINFDPPYVNKGGQLYMNFFQESDHKKLKAIIDRSSRKWMVTYDECKLIENLYSKYRKSHLNLTYSANGSRKARELVYFSNNLIIPDQVALDLR